MSKKLVIILCILSYSLNNCMEKENNEKNDVQKIDKHFDEINQCLKSAGLLSDISKIIGAYDGYRFYFKKNQIKRATIGDIVYSDDNKYLATASLDKTINIFNLDNNSKDFTKCIYTFDASNGGHSDCVTALEHCGNINCLASGSADGSLKIWDLDNEKVRCLYVLYQSNVKFYSATVFSQAEICHLRYCKDFKYLASVVNEDGEDREIKIFDLDKNSETFKKCLYTFNKTNGGHKEHVSSLIYCSNIRTLASGSSDGTIKLWDLNNGNLIKTLDDNIKNRCYISLEYCPINKFLISINSIDKNIHIWDLDNNKTFCNRISNIKANFKHNDESIKLFYDKKNKYLIIGHGMVINIFNLNTLNQTPNQLPYTIDVNDTDIQEPIASLGLCENNKHLAVGQELGIKIFINMESILGN